MFLRRSPIGLFLMVGFGLLLGAALFGGTEAVGSVVAAPFLVLGFMFKVVLFFMLFGLVAKIFAGSVGRGRRSGTGPAHPEDRGLMRPRPMAERFKPTQTHGCRKVDLPASVVVDSHHVRSKRSFIITLSHAATKSRTNFSSPSLAP